MKRKRGIDGKDLVETKEMFENKIDRLSEERNQLLYAVVLSQDG